MKSIGNVERLEEMYYVILSMYTRKSHSVFSSVEHKSFVTRLCGQETHLEQTVPSVSVDLMDEEPNEILLRNKRPSPSEFLFCTMFHSG